MIVFKITKHAVDRYRDRVLNCPERSRSDQQLREAIRWQLEEFPMRTLSKALVIAAGPLRPKKRKPWELTLSYPTHMFVVEGASVVTTLGFDMHPLKAATAKTRRRRIALYRERAAALPSVALSN